MTPAFLQRKWLHLTCRGADQSLRVFDVENGIMLLAPNEEMECDALARQDSHVVARCGGGAAMLVLKYTDGEEELEEVDFIECSGEGKEDEEQSERVFFMKGGHKLSVSAEVEFSVILVGQSCATGFSIRMLKNRSYIT